MINAPSHVTQRPNAQPEQSNQATSVTAGSGQGAGQRIMLPGGLEVNTTAIYITGAALAALVLYKAVS